jgi:hypothetical protein
MPASGNLPSGLRLSAAIIPAIVLVASSLLGQQSHKVSTPSSPAAAVPAADDPAGSPAAAATAPQLHRPDFLPSPGRYVGSVNVKIVSTEIAIYRFTLDGSEPTSNSPVFPVEGLTFKEDTIIKAIATRGGFSNSPVATGEYKITQRTPTPVFHPAPGKYGFGELLTITDPDGTATIRFTTDGSTPNHKSPIYEKPYLLLGIKTIKAIAISAGRADSEVISGTYETPR